MFLDEEFNGKKFLSFTLKVTNFLTQNQESQRISAARVEE